MTQAPASDSTPPGSGRAKSQTGWWHRYLRRNMIGQGFRLLVILLIVLIGAFIMIDNWIVRAILGILVITITVFIMVTLVRLGGEP